jgi:proteic killer suppression protein
VNIRNVIHKGLKRLVERDDTSGLPPATIEKIRNIVSFLQSMAGPDELRTIPSWKAHRLTGNRRGTWSLSVTRNWRLTFRIEESDGEIVDLDFEDYH